jgi:hypothetical protein
MHPWQKALKKGELLVDMAQPPDRDQVEIRLRPGP